MYIVVYMNGNFYKKKSLGQNFLKSKKFVGDMVRVAEISSKDTVLEIGPGKGILTAKLLKSAGRVVAVEKDHRLIPKLKEKFGLEIKKGKIEIVGGDALEISVTKLGLENLNYKIVANIPYYISGAFLEKFLSDNIQPDRVVVMLQKEVAKRIVAVDGKESILSISVKAYGLPKYISTVKRNNFSPAPKVDSAILQISDISRKNFEKIDEKRFFDLLRAGFSHKRKKLAGNLANFAGKDKVEEILKLGKLNINCRAENLKLEDWLFLASRMSRPVE